MKNIIISVSRETREVNLSKTALGLDGENLQENLVFKFIDEFVDGQARLEYNIDENKNYIILDKEDDSYVLPVKNILTKEGQVFFQLVITDGTDEDSIPVFKSNQFYLIVRESINAVTEAPEGYELWIEKVNVKLNQIDKALEEVANLDIDAEKLEDTATVTITKKDGTQKSVEIKDGKEGKDATINGRNTIEIEAGKNVDIEETEKGIKINAVGGGSGGGAVDSVNGQIGEVVLNAQDVGALPNTTKIPTKISDLTNDSGYVKNTDYADNSKFGVVKTDSNYGIQTENGVLYINRATAAQIKTRHQWAPITPKNFDFALKTGMCDGVGEAWTEDEKLKAQERIGVSKIPSGMTLTADVVLEESVERVNFNEIIVKNYEKLIIYVFRPATTFSSGHGSVSFSSSVGGGLGGTDYNAFSTNQKINVRHTMVKTDGTKFEVTSEWVNAGNNINDTAFIKSAYKPDANPYSGYLVINTTQAFPVGTHILIYTK